MKFDIRLVITIMDGRSGKKIGDKNILREVKSQSWEMELDRFLAETPETAGKPVTVNIAGIKTIDEDEPVLEIIVVCRVNQLETKGTDRKDKSVKPKETEKNGKPADTLSSKENSAEKIKKFDSREVVEIYTDGGSRGNPGIAGVGIYLRQAATGFELKRGRSLGVATNNVAEYKALIEGLEQAVEIGARKIRHFADSELMVRQLNGRYKVKNPELIILHDRARSLIARFESFSTKHVPRARNAVADAMANQAMDEVKKEDVETEGQAELGI